MLPSLLTRDIQDGLKQFLVTGFEPSDGHLHGLMSRFVDEAQSSAWLKGPFVQMGLPFRHGRGGRHFFPGFELKFPGYSHQERAWMRLRSGSSETRLRRMVSHLRWLLRFQGADPRKFEARDGWRQDIEWMRRALGPMVGVR